LNIAKHHISMKSLCWSGTGGCALML